MATERKEIIQGSVPIFRDPKDPEHEIIGLFVKDIDAYAKKHGLEFVRIWHPYTLELTIIDNYTFDKNEQQRETTAGGDKDADTSPRND